MSKIFGIYSFFFMNRNLFFWIYVVIYLFIYVRVRERLVRLYPFHSVKIIIMWSTLMKWANVCPPTLKYCCPAFSSWLIISKTPEILTRRYFFWQSKLTDRLFMLIPWERVFSDFYLLSSIMPHLLQKLRPPWCMHATLHYNLSAKI